ncbi:spindle pole body protein Sfi1 [Schizosaccharomyces cryophilus OY26]|uniref:Spindle pole body protein Sfi1 n=1 Tax=Schizosaccharomyces cryophilus (strain OY26 / ATCC MYA-4695 / CBS 11777 / NBRC 106824 / NRRL Y48691) TaxID=653667 RepID=S9VSY5_SCHCR|nr:spindle pole body protein Sfi1 [Schizosaccharomyces cryophilus OY26]EPY49274.1 spindle pole body protein Sfi1 [Schizosaccharomyces cryophilus OY26]
MSKNDAQNRDIDHGRRIMSLELRRDLEILRRILLRLSASKEDSSPLSVFKAYENVLRENGLSPSENRYYIRVLFRLISTKRYSWEQEWKNLMSRMGFSHLSSSLQTPLLSPSNHISDDPFIVRDSDKKRITLQEKENVKDGNNFASNAAKTIKSLSAMSRLADQFRSIREHQLLATTFYYLLDKHMYQQRIATIYERKATAVHRTFLLLKYFPVWVQKMRQVQEVMSTAETAYNLVVQENFMYAWRKKTREVYARYIEEQKKVFLHKAILQWNKLANEWKEKHERILLLRFLTQWKLRKKQQSNRRVEAVGFYNHTLCKNCFRAWRLKSTVLSIKKAKRKSVLASSYLKWRDVSAKKQELRNGADFKYIRNVGKAVISKWYSKTSGYYAQCEKADEFRDRTLLENMLSNWKSKTTTCRKLDDWMDEHDVEILKSALERWRHRYSRIEDGLQLANYILQDTFLTRWRLALKTNIFRENKEYALLVQFYKFWRIREKERAFEYNYNQRLLVKTWDTWIERTQGLLEVKDVAEDLHQERQIKAAKNCILKWRMQLLEKEELLIHADGLYKKNVKLKVWSRWKYIMQRKARLRWRADLMYDKKLLKLSMQLWRGICEEEITIKLETKVVDYQSSIDGKLVERYWNFWIEKVMKLSALSMVADQARQRVLIRAYEAWSYQHSELKGKLERAERFYNERLLRSALIFWRYQLRAVQFLQNISDWKRREFDRGIMRRAFDSWNLLTFRVTSHTMQAERFYQQKQSKLLGKMFRRWIQRYRINKEDSSILENTTGMDESSSFMHAFDTTMPLQYDSVLGTPSNFQRQWKQELKTPISRFSKYLRPIPPKTQ